MIDSTIQRLIERTIDSPLKLQLLLLFCEHQNYTGTPSQIGQRAYRDIWSTREALRELAEDGVLMIQHSNAGEPIYCYHPLPELADSINKLYVLYNEPIERDDLQRLVRDAASYAPYRRARSGGFEQERYSYAF
ncbi:hypothetical protein F8S13_24780 [Chloroflexia bacterium SDU3-3]|nr:hypothetical protein F8S13_24780 [Chloroflexia bacterium SDU3-3]